MPPPITTLLYTAGRVLSSKLISDSHGFRQRNYLHNRVTVTHHCFKSGNIPKIGGDQLRLEAYQEFPTPLDRGRRGRRENCYMGHVHAYRQAHVGVTASSGMRHPEAQFASFPPSRQQPVGHITGEDYHRMLKITRRKQRSSRASQHDQKRERADTIIDVVLRIAD